MTTPAYILASASPRRRLLLEQAGYRFEVDPSGVEEPEPGAETLLVDYVAELAWKKARSVARRRGSGLILGADTACSAGGLILNKPTDRLDAERMIRLQESRDVEVATGLCLYRADLDEWLGAVEVSIVRLRALEDLERTRYLESGQWAGMAGAYGLQNEDPWITIGSGSWSNVVGLPLERLAQMLVEYPGLTRGLS